MNTARRPKTRTLAVLLVAALTTLLAACGGSGTGNEDAVREDGSVDLSKVTLIVGDQKASSQQALLEAAGLDDTDYEIDYKQFTSGPPMMEALGSGAIHVGYVGNTPPIIAAASGSEFKVVQAVSYGGEGDAILVPKDSDITSVDQLKGKKIAVAEGSSANYNLVAQLDKVGLSYDDVEIQNLQPADALAAFSQGHLDAWVTWEPYVSQAELEQGGRVLATGDGVVNGLNFQLASNEALDDKATTTALEDYAARITEAQVWASKNPEVWSKVWAEQTGLTPEVTAAAVKKRPLTVLPIDDSIVDTEQEIADAFSDNGILPEAVDLEDYFSDRFNEDLSEWFSTPDAAGATPSPAE